MNTIIRTRFILIFLTLATLLLALLPLRGSAAQDGLQLRAGWQQIAMDTGDSVGGGPVPLKIVHIGSGLGILGSGYGLNSLLWTSPDARSWTRIPVDPTIFSDSTRIIDLMAGGPGLVAVGGKTELKQGEKPYAAVWTSPDGHAWTRVPDSPVFAGAAMSQLVAGSHPLLALGTDYANASGSSGYRVRPVIWTSKDGLGWNRGELTDPTFLNAQIVGVTHGGKGLLAMGAAAPFPQTPRPAAWTSVAGDSWTPIPLDPKVFPDNAVIYRVISGPHGVMALGGIADPGGVIRYVTWTSGDGATWKMSGADPFAQGTVREVATIGGAYVAIGERETDPVLWSSPDGLTWTREVDGEVFRGSSVVLTAISPFGDGLVITGDVGGGSSGSTPTVWLWTPQAATGATPVPTSTPSRLDPRSLRLRLDELPSGFHLEAEGSTAICDLAGGPDPRHRCQKIRQALGSNHAYSFQFTNPTKVPSQPAFVEGWIVAVHNAAAAKRVFRVGTILANELARAFYFHHDRRISTTAMIGQETRIYFHSVNRLNRVQNAYSVLWRDGRDIGEIVTGGLGRNAAINAALHYARILHNHYASAGP